MQWEPRGLPAPDARLQSGFRAAVPTAPTWGSRPAAGSTCTYASGRTPARASSLWCPASHPPSQKLPHLQPSWRGHLCRTPGRPLNWGSIALSLFLLTYSQDSVSCPCCCQPSSCRSSAQTSGDCPLGGLTALQGPHGAPCQPPTRVSTRPVPPISSVPSNAPSSPRPKQPVSQSTGTLLSLSRLHVP